MSRITQMEYLIHLVLTIICPLLKSDNSHCLDMSYQVGVQTNSPDVKVQLTYIWAFPCWCHLPLTLHTAIP